jgi:hypothetical protein
MTTDQKSLVTTCTMVGLRIKSGESLVVMPSFHQTLHVTPAMEAGISNHVWSLEEIVNLLR